MEGHLRCARLKVDTSLGFPVLQHTPWILPCTRRSALEITADGHPQKSKEVSVAGLLTELRRHVVTPKDALSMVGSIKRPNDHERALLDEGVPN